MKGLFSKCKWRGTALVALLLLAVTASAVPAKPGLTRQLTLSNGTTVTATLVGDEYGHFWKGVDGKSYQAVAGTGIYQEVNGQEIIKKAKQRRTQANSRRAQRLASHRVGEIKPVMGEKKGLIILVNFQDVKFQPENDKAFYERIANEKNFKYGNFQGSMYDYFLAQSEKKFELTFDVVGPVTVSREQAYYGENKDERGSDKHPAEMVIEALTLADPYVNYADYVWKEGGTEVDQVYVVYADKGEADGGPDYTIWPHEWTLGSANYFGDGAGPQTLDGVKIDTYACGGELMGTMDVPTINGIGTMCHEFAHCLGYPDFYDTDYSGGQGMGYWDLMDGGSYNNGGYLPAGFTSYERWIAGWKTPTELTSTQSISNMKALQDEGSDTYIIYNKLNSNEYYLLENRQKVGWDAALPGAGLLILHVDYDATVWAYNQPNDDPAHQRLTWVPANNNYKYEEGGAYPYKSNNALGRNTTPAATLYNKNWDNSFYLDCSIENITQNEGGTISFDFVVDPWSITLNNDDPDNSTIINLNVSEKSDVYLDGRTLKKNGEWNTICLPFDVTLAGSVLDGATAKTLTNATMVGSHVTLTFGDAVTKLEAGVPYIIKWDSGEDIVNPLFSGVTIKESTKEERTITKAGGNVKFIGYFDAFDIAAGNDDIYYMTAGNKLAHTGIDRTLKACRAYFQFSEAAVAASELDVELDFGDDINGNTTGISSLTSSPKSEGIVYNLAGQRVTNPTKGLYIVNGKKYMVK